MPKFLQQLQALWAGLSGRQKISLVLVSALVSGGLWAFQRWSVEQDFKPLYTDMSSEEAGSVVARLRELNVPYRLNETGATVLIPSARLAETRLQLATTGLPQRGRIGFELFDQTKFGATEFAEQVNYRRALEGELERSMLSLNQVEQARVHISPGKDSIFLDHQQPAKGSVVVKLRRSQRLDPHQVRGVAYLVASAVEGLSPDMVAVLDVAGNLLSRPRRAGAETGEELELQQKVERETAQKILHTVEPYLGENKARASVSAEVELNTGEQTEEVLDPNPVVVLSQKTDEQSQPAWAGGPPGTASSVPRGTPRPLAGGTTLSRKQENSSYQVSKTVTRTRLEKGAIKRLSVAVIVDHKASLNPSGQRVVTPRTAAELKMIRDLVVAAAGILESRGDLLTIENLPFEGPEVLPVRPGAPPVVPGWIELLQGLLAKEWLKKYRYVALGVLVGIIGLIALLIWRLRRKAAATRAAVVHQETATETMAKQLADMEAAQRQADEAVMLELKMPQVTSNKSMVLRKVLTDTAKKDPAGTVQLLRSWIHENES